ncbi:MAG TPA: DUF6797 domain-containing protein, partial [Candidatus Kapabacteria bacterium]|nr:DUF6797 domain-containing protein [Candidatus Kapabacteria bacterium]
AQVDKVPPYLRMNFGPVLNGTYEVAPGNIAYKGIAIRLDPGEGGISKGNAWIVYDHDTMHVAAAWTGTNFIDWKSIAFDGSHGTHPSIVGNIAFTLPSGSGWANPKTGQFADERLRGLDGKPYGPLPREWTHFKGLYQHGNSVILRYTVGSAEILESPGLIAGANSTIFTRTLNISASPHDLNVRLAPKNVRVKWQSDQAVEHLIREDTQVLRIPGSSTPIKIVIAIASAENPGEPFNSLQPELLVLRNLQPLTKGAAARWNFEMQTQPQGGSHAVPFAVDELTLPPDQLNPWKSWMRLTGLDFYPDKDVAAVCTWMGEVWLVHGISEGSHLRWKRIGAGLFQPLGLKIVDQQIYVTCRDQLVRLVDVNGDEEIDFYENFNSDHQVTEHFHEFAMGLQTDRDGNFYYAKSARHALPPLVPHHGTLLKVSKDGLRTDIIASGFRAANGVCVNDDGTFFVTDQEGHWTPKNRINYIVPGRFYGNMWSYHHPDNSSDSAMEQPLVWITNEMDRSPGELVRLNTERWGPLQGSILNLSYGTGRIFLVPYEFIDGQVQGGVVQLPIAELPTGVMRGRIHPKSGALFACGMVAWASNKTQDGGLYRIYPTGKPTYLPLRLRAIAGGLELTFTEPLDKTSAENTASYSVKTWSLKRSENYGSKHLNERPLRVTRATLASDSKTVRLELAGLKPTWSMEIRCNLSSASGETFERVIHNTVHKIPAGK